MFVDTANPGLYLCDLSDVELASLSQAIAEECATRLEQLRDQLAGLRDAHPADLTNPKGPRA